MHEAPPELFLKATAIVDHQQQQVRALALARSQGCRHTVEVVRSCFEWVRDEVEHTGDYERERVTCSASEVLLARTGFCYAKSHLLAALLRANDIPCGFVYQRLSCGGEGEGSTYCLHGLNAVWLPGLSWYRLDARGKRADLPDAACEPPLERLPFPGDGIGERTFAGVWAEPVERVVRALRSSRTRLELLAQLPDAVELGEPDAC